jgi:hypothetical protein
MKNLPNREFEYCVLTFNGYNKLLVPREAALQFFRGLLGKELYTVESWYDNGNSHELVEAIDPSRMPSISAYSAVQFHLGRANAERKAEKDAKSKLE